MYLLRWISLPFAWAICFALGNLLAALFNMDLLLYAVGPYLAVASTAYLAPKGKKYTAIVFATLTCLLMAVSAAGFFYSGRWFKGILAIVGIVGAIIPACEDYDEPPTRA